MSSLQVSGKHTMRTSAGLLASVLLTIGVVQSAQPASDVNAQAADGATPLLQAAYDGDVAKVAALLKAGADPRMANRYGASPMGEAARLSADALEWGVPGHLREKLAALVQCGFPETLQTRPAVDIMRQFAREAGFGWTGALALGMGGAIGGKRLEKTGGVARNVHRALDLAAASLAAGGDIPAEAAPLLEKPLMPKWLYIIAANWGFRNEIKKQGARKRACDRPYA